MLDLREQCSLDLPHLTRTLTSAMFSVIALVIVWMNVFEIVRGLAQVRTHSDEDALSLATRRSVLGLLLLGALCTDRSQQQGSLPK